MNNIKAKLSGKKEIERSLTRLAHEIIEKNDDLDTIAIVGIRTRGDYLAQRLHKLIEKLSSQKAAGVESPITGGRKYKAVLQGDASEFYPPALKFLLHMHR